MTEGSVAMDVPQKWMVYFRENPIKMDDLGVPLVLRKAPVWVKKMTFMDDLVVSENGGILQVPKSPLVSKWSNDLDDLGVASL